MLKKLILFSAVVFTLSSAFSIARPVLAQSSSVIDNNATEYQEGDYSLNSIVDIIIGSSQIILGIIGSITLLMFVYGGLMFLISGGSSEKVTKAKGILTAAVIGLIIVFSSYLIIKFAFQAMGRDDFKGEQMKINRNTIITEVIRIS